MNDDTAILDELKALAADFKRKYDELWSPEEDQKWAEVIVVERS